MRARGVWRCSLDGQKIEYYETALDAIKWVRENLKYKGCVKTAIWQFV